MEANAWGVHMNSRLRVAAGAAISSLALCALAVPAAQANPLSLLPGSCGPESDSQPFAQWGDTSNYTLVPGGDFEAGSPSWGLSRGAAVGAGNETFQVHGAADQSSLQLPADSSAISFPACTSIYHPTLRLFVRNTGASSSRLRVEVLYPGLLGSLQTAQVADLSGSSEWAPTPTMSLTLTNLLATLSLSRTAVAFRFIPQSGGNWSIDDVYLDPHMRG